MNKEDLIAHITSKSHRDLSSEMDNFIRLAEQRISRSVRAKEMIAHYTLSDEDRINEEFPVYQLPTGFLEDITVIYGDPDQSAESQNGNLKPFKDKLTVTDIMRLSMDGSVRYYAVSNDEMGSEGSETGPLLIVRGNPPMSDEDYDTLIKVIYFSAPRALTTSASTNKLLENHEELYLSSCLFELYQHTQDLELAQGQLDIFENTKEELNAQAGRFLGGTRFGGRKYTIGGKVSTSY